MSMFRNWYVRHQDAITWFVIGLLSLATVNYAVQRDWLWAGGCVVLIMINYKLRKFRMQ